MIWYFLKLVITAAIIVIISEVSKRLPLLGSLIASLPLVSVLGMIWMYGETRDLVQCGSCRAVWYVLPSLPMFLLMPWMLRKGLSFPFTLSAGISDWTFIFYHDQSFGEIWHEFIIRFYELGFMCWCST